MMETPTRAMDEFDVFMDSINRTIAINLLIESARSNSSKQYIFITPQSYKQIESGPDIKIHKMHPPQRNQTSLNFNLQTQLEEESD